MEFSIKSGSPEKQRVACVIVGVYEIKKLSFAAELIDKTSGGTISEILRRGDITGKLGTCLMLHKVPNLLCDRILLVGLGPERDFNEESYRRANRSAMQAVLKTTSLEIANYLAELPCRKQSVEWMVEQAVLIAQECAYRFDSFKRLEKEEGLQLQKIVLAVPRRKDLAEGEYGLEQGIALANGIKLTKSLANLPANICTPEYLAEKARELANRTNAEVDILGTNEIEKEDMQALLAVAKGSASTPYFIVLKYNGATNEKTKPVILVGKGITFDSGGICLKPASGMDEMKYDMSGAAAVLGVFQAAIESQLSLNLVVLIPACENMTGSHACHPGDIVKTRAGLTVEIINTDAEGRLILCDALSYAESFNPQLVIDVATLTGACVIALGHLATGVFSNQDELAKDMVAAGKSIGDRAWQLPIWKEYRKQLKSPFADISNVGGRDAGSITAACFLSYFTEEYDWIHLDIAGTAWQSGAEKGATGRPVPMLMQFLREYVQSGDVKTARKGRQGFKVENQWTEEEDDDKTD